MLLSAFLYHPDLERQNRASPHDPPTEGQIFEGQRPQHRSIKAFTFVRPLTLGENWLFELLISDRHQTRGAEREYSREIVGWERLSGRLLPLSWAGEEISRQ